MITLEAGQTLQGSAGTATAVTYTVLGDELTTATGIDTFKVLAQGQLGLVAAALGAAVPVGKAWLVKAILLANATGSAVASVKLFVGGSAAANQIVSLTVPANGEATYGSNGWQLLDANGALVTGFAIPNDTVTYAQMQNVSASPRALARVTVGAGDVEEATSAQVTSLLVDDATTALPGRLTAVEKIELNSLDGRTSAGASKRVFRPGDYMVGNTYDPTGAANSTASFSAMMTAVRAFNDRCTIQLAPGVFKIDPDIIKDFGTNNPSVSIEAPGRGLCILLPSAAGNIITLNRGTTGGDAITMRGFTIYNTSGTPFTSGAGILTNGADGVDISEVAFIDLFRDVQVSGQPYTMTTAGTTAITGVSPVLVAADVGKTVSGPGIVAGTTIATQAGATGTLSVAATVSTTDTRFIENSIKVSMQKIVSFNTNGNGNGVGIYVSNGQAGDTYIGPEIVMSDGGGTTRRRACVEIVESGHYEITQANLTGSQRGILIDPGASQSVAFGFHTNVLCDSNTVNGMRVDATTATSTIKNIKSVNSWYSGTTVVNGSAAAAGALTTGAGTINGFTFTTDRFLNNRTHGFEHGAGTDFRWSDCDMKGNSSVGSGTADGLNVAANIGNWSINGGKYGGTDTVPTAGNQRYGINVAAGTGNNIKISPDDLSGNVTGPLSLGATGVNVFVNGCPGLAAPYTRGASSATITTVITLSNMLIPKNSVRVGTTFRLKALCQQITAASIQTFTVRLGATNDAVGAASTNAVVWTAADAAGAINDWVSIEALMTVTAIGAAGNLQGSGFGVKGAATFPAAIARASGAGFLAVDTTADRYLTLAVTSASSGIVCHNATIEVVNY